jgi:hypothetical protein
LTFLERFHDSTQNLAKQNKVQWKNLSIQL